MSERWRDVGSFLAVASAVILISVPLLDPLFNDQVQRRVDSQAMSLAAGIEQALVANVAAAYGAGVALPAALPGLSARSYAARLEPVAAAGMLDDVAAVALAQLVPADEVTNRVDQWNGSVRADLQLRLGDGPTHAIITHSWPHAANRATIGVDILGVDELRPVALRALAGDISMTGPYRLIQEPDDQLAAITYLRLDGPDGEAVGIQGVVIRHQALFDRIHTPISGMRSELIHVPTATVVASGGQIAPGRSFEGEAGFELYGQQWLVRSEGDPRSPAAFGRQAWWALPLLLGVSAASVLGYLVKRRSARLARSMAAERTADLQAAQERLRAAVDDLAEANRVKDEVLAAVSHDVRTPLTVIGGFARTLAANPGEEILIRTVLPRIAHQVSRLETLVDDLLHATGAEQGPGNPPEDVEVVALCRRVLSDLGFGRLVNDREHLVVTAVARDLERVLDNLLTNARRHGSAPIDVEVSARGDVAEVAVRDHGRGIAADHAEAIFDPYHQVGRRRGGGVGLGLTIAMRLCRGMGGDLRYEDAPGGGARFVVTLPLATDAPDQRTADPAEDREDDPRDETVFGAPAPSDR